MRVVFAYTYLYTMANLRYHKVIGRAGLVGWPGRGGLTLGLFCSVERCRARGLGLGGQGLGGLAGVVLRVGIGLRGAVAVAQSASPALNLNILNIYYILYIYRVYYIYNTYMYIYKYIFVYKYTYVIFAYIYLYTKIIL